MDFQATAKKATLRAIGGVTGRPGSCTVRFTHLYPDGAAAYFIWNALRDKAKLVGQFWAIKAAASEAMVNAGGIMVHHHALGRDHRIWYDRKRPQLFGDAVRVVKRRLDPHHVLNQASGSIVEIDESLSRCPFWRAFRTQVRHRATSDLGQFQTHALQQIVPVEEQSTASKAEVSLDNAGGFWANQNQDGS